MCKSVILYVMFRKKVSKFCFIDGFIELIVVLDTSANVKILDHRIMKETVKAFLKENFDLRENRVRVGIVTLGSEVCFFSLFFLSYSLFTQMSDCRSKFPLR